jgi:hypothetical protein
MAADRGFHVLFSSPCGVAHLLRFNLGGQLLQISKPRARLCLFLREPGDGRLGVATLEDSRGQRGLAPRGVDPRTGEQDRTAINHLPGLS